MTTKTKAPKDAPLCSCGCNQKTRGGTFRMGHDQRLRGFLSRGEDLKPIAAKFVAAQPKSSEWRHLQAAGIKWLEAKVAKQAEREAAKAERAKAKLSDKTRGKRAKRATKARKVARRVKAQPVQQVEAPAVTQ